MAELRFEWDERKERTNRAKHRIDFQEAATTFYDPNALVISDPDHSDNEDRFVLLGWSYRLRLLVVCHCHRQGGDVIRIISARRATRREQRQYQERPR